MVGERSLCSKLWRCVLIVEGHVYCILIYCMESELSVAATQLLYTA